MSEIVLKKNTKINSLLEEHPSLLNKLADINPKFNKFKNPILRKTVGRRATLADVADMIGIPLDTLLNIISDEVRSDLTLEDVKKGVDRKEALKQLILDLHEGGDYKELKNRFNLILGDVDSSEIAIIEQQLIDSGDLKVEEITKLCDLHIGIFEDALNEHESPETVPGHPLNTYMEENKKAQMLINKIRKSALDEDIKKLEEILIHYTRLENQLFPILEQKNFSGPSQVMWAKHDEIRSLFKNTQDPKQLDVLLKSVEDMITKEERILFPTALEKLAVSDWVKVREGEEEIGYAWLESVPEWRPVTPETIHQMDKKPSLEELVDLDTGMLSKDQINLMLKNLPVDISFVDENDTLLYYSNTKERIFPRSPGVIGRKVQYCHPKKSVDMVNKILDAFKQGKKDVAEFWIQMKGKFIHIRYFALRDEDGKYRGTLEVSQDVTNIKKLEGNKRLLDWDDEN
ncbi:MAG: DUF438 domain-containing protein [Candidatus Hodarchaeales archaeon]